MRKSIIVVIFQFVLICHAFPQTDERYFEFGKISREEIMMNSYQLDTTAAAVVLFDIGEAFWTFSESGYKRHTRIKIFKKEGYQWADGIIALSKGGLRPSKFKAATYNIVNGKMETTKLTSEGFFTEDFNEYIDIIRFAMPNVKEGSIIEFYYELPWIGLADWEFQRTIPTIWSEYKTYVFLRYLYDKLVIGYLTPNIHEEKMIYRAGTECKYERFVMKEIPAFWDEPFIPTSSNYKSKISYNIATIGQFNIFSTWNDLAIKYHDAEFFADNVARTGLLKKISLELTDKLETPDLKVLAIVDYVKRNMTWDNRYRHRTRDIKKAIENKTGNSAEINLTLLAMLRYAGLPADPVLVSTRENGFVRRETPNPYQFNHVIVLTDLRGSKFLLDATNKNLSYDFLPESCLNDYGYIAIREKAGWVKLENLKKSRVALDCNFEITDNTDLKGEMKIQKSGYDAEATRRAIHSEGESKYTDAFFSTYNVGVKQPNFINLNDENVPLVENHSVELNGYLEGESDVFYLNPIVLSRIEDNPFREPTRTYPIDFKYPKETVYSAKFKIPEGFRIDELPSSKMSILPDNNGKFVYNISSDGKTITAVFQLIINKSFFSLEEYPLIREFFRIVSEKSKEQIVLKLVK